MKKIDKSLLNWILSIDKEEQIFARAYGSFSVPRMDFNIFISAEETKKFDAAMQQMSKKSDTPVTDGTKKDFYRYIQAHNHELFHYYQAYALPAFNIYQKLSKINTEYEAIVMLRYFEEGNSYILGEDRNLFDALRKTNFSLLDNEIEDFNDFMKKYQFYQNQWKLEYQQLSLFYIIEGMAHIMSTQHTEESKNYLPETDNIVEYNIAYEIFSSHVNDQYKYIDIRIKHLVFLYICYFSCQIYSVPEDEDQFKTHKMFYTLCANLNSYFETFYDLLDKYSEYTDSQLRQIQSINIEELGMSLVNKNQLIQIYSFFDLVSTIKKDAEAEYDFNSFLTLNTANEIIEIFSSLNINITDYFQLAKLALFPVKMGDLWEIYAKIQKTKIDNKSFNVKDENGFYELIHNCKKLLNEKISFLPCCEEHGLVNNKATILYCENEGGTAYFLKELIQRDAFDLFKIQET